MDVKEKYEGLKLDYISPRWTGEILDCSMPMTFDTYSVCAFNCLYCFAFFQKEHTLKGYMARNVRAVNPERVKKLFRGALANDPDSISKADQQFFPYIQHRKIMQWGALADQFDETERKYGLTLELLKFFDEIDYPLSLSTKGTWWTEDERYMSLFKKHTHNWHVKISIITMDERKARGIELLVPSPKERMKALKRLSDIGISTTLRLRPYIIGVSDDWRDTIDNAVEAGVKSVTTEFFCLESRADERLKKRYATMSKVVGYDLFKFYLNSSHQAGYKRLSPAIKDPIIRKMRDYVHSKGLLFFVSDATDRHLSDAPNCCGVPPSWNSQTAHFGGALLIAKEKGEVHFSDIAKDLKELFTFEWIKATQFNTGTNKNRAVFYNTKMYEWMRYVWNNPNLGTSPAKMYNVLAPNGVDKRGDIIYKFVGKK